MHSTPCKNHSDDQIKKSVMGEARSTYVGWNASTWNN